MNDDLLQRCEAWIIYDGALVDLPLVVRDCLQDCHDRITELEAALLASKIKPIEVE